MNSLLGTLPEVGDIAGWFRGDSIPPVNNQTITLNARLVNLLLPGFSRHYGADSIVDLHFNVTDISGFVSSAANQDITVYPTVDI